MRRGQGGGGIRPKFEKPIQERKGILRGTTGSSNIGKEWPHGMGMGDFGDIEGSEKEVHTGFYNKFRDDFDLEDLK